MADSDVQTPAPQAPPMDPTPDLTATIPVPDQMNVTAPYQGVPPLDSSPV